MLNGLHDRVLAVITCDLQQCRKIRRPKETSDARMRRMRRMTLSNGSSVHATAITILVGISSLTHFFANVSTHVDCTKSGSWSSSAALSVSSRLRRSNAQHLRALRRYSGAPSSTVA